jgi:hypothetical protein
MVTEFMIALVVNSYVWQNLKQDSTLYQRYATYTTQFGPTFSPFFPVEDNLAGDISWGTEPYFLYDSTVQKPTRNVYGERHEQIMYTLVGKIEDIFTLRDTVVRMFDEWSETKVNASGYRINDIDVWQPDRIRGRDKLRQLYSTTLLLDVHYHIC